MIGMVTKGQSFYHCISYCLEDKRSLSEEQKKQLSLAQGVQHKDRAEVLEYNQCYGDKRDLASQMKDVRKLNTEVEKPVLHLAIRVAPGDHMTNGQLTEIGRAAAEEFGIAQNQYVCILHKDTKEQHIHIVGNRVGFDGKVASDSQDYRRMAELCRKLEKKYDLQKVLSPRPFLSPKDRQIQRQDQRKERLKAAIREALNSSRTYPEFEKKMQAKGYQVDKGRGIAFEDDKKVRTKGSEVGYSWQKIEGILQIQQNRKEVQKPVSNHPTVKGETQKAREVISQDLDHWQPPDKDLHLGAGLSLNVTDGLVKILNELMKPTPNQESMGSPMQQEEERRKRKKKKGLGR